MLLLRHAGLSEQFGVCFVTSFTLSEGHIRIASANSPDCNMAKATHRIDPRAAAGLRI